MWSGVTARGWRGGHAGVVCCATGASVWGMGAAMLMAMGQVRE